MNFRIGSLRPGQLLASWCLYWLALVVAVLAPAVPTLWRVTRPDAHGNASASYGDGVLKLLVSDGAANVWTRDLRLGVILLFVAVPPLVLWALWFRAQRGRRTSLAADRVG